MKDSIRTVFFDFDGTLVFHEPDSFEVTIDFCVEIGQPLSPEDKHHGRRMQHEYFLDPHIREKLSSLSTDEFWLHYNQYRLEALGIEGDIDHLAKELTDRIASLEFSYTCPEAGCRTLVELRARDYGVGLITNREHVERFHVLLDQLGMWPYFDTILASGEVGISKPEPGIFHAAMTRIEATPESSLYIGDNYWADVVGARRAGLTPVLLDPHDLFPESDCLVLKRIDDLLAWQPVRR